ncbi:hypothetical protein NN6n1_43710 [Shinella zoogloeoides]
MRQRFTTLHRLISLGLAVAVPGIATLVNGEIRIEFIVLGLVVGAAYWYWGPAGAPL